MYAIGVTVPDQLGIQSDFLFILKVIHQKDKLYQLGLL